MAEFLGDPQIFDINGTPWENTPEATTFMGSADETGAPAPAPAPAPASTESSWFDDLLSSKTGQGLLNLGISSATEFLGGNDPKIDKAGYQGGIPAYEVQRERVPNLYDPNRRPGSAGRRYFSDIQYIPKTTGPVLRDAADLASINAQNVALANAMPVAGGVASVAPPMAPPMAPASAPSGIVSAAKQPWNSRPEYASDQDWQGYLSAKAAAEKRRNEGFMSQVLLDGEGGYDHWKKGQVSLDNYAAGGIARLNRGRYLGGPTDGMADVVPANIEGTQEARLSDGEFVMPADIVSHLGNGNSNAGAETLYAMMDRIRKARTGTKKQGKKINTNNFLPV